MINYKGIVLCNVGNGVSDENFFTLTITEIQEILKHYSAEVVLKFVSVFLSKKEIIKQNVGHTISMVIYKESTDTVPEEAFLLNSNLNVGDSVYNRN